MKRRTTPYTERGIRRMKCCRCQSPARFQWQACSDGGTFRPLCVECDIALNKLVIEFLGIPNVDKTIEVYRDSIS